MGDTRQGEASRRGEDFGNRKNRDTAPLHGMQNFCMRPRSVLDLEPWHRNSIFQTTTLCVLHVTCMCISRDQERSEGRRRAQCPRGKRALLGSRDNTDVAREDTPSTRQM